MTPAGYYERKPLVERFWSKVDKTGGPDACWPWKAALSPSGYGVFGTAPDRAHRVAFELANGVKLEKGELVMHTCDNPPCCNDRHLRAGTPAENMADKVAKGREARGEHVGTSKLTTTDIVAIRLRAARGEIQARLAEAFGVSQTSISYIVKRRTWAHVPEGQL